MYIDAPNRPNKNKVNQKKTPWGFGRTVECQWRESTRDKPCFLILLFRTYVRSMYVYVFDSTYNL